MAHEISPEPPQGERARWIKSMPRARVESALSGMDLEKRAVFVRSELQGESCPTIAAALGVPLHAVYSGLYAARREFSLAYARLTRALPCASALRRRHA